MFHMQERQLLLSLLFKKKKKKKKTSIMPLGVFLVSVCIIVLLGAALVDKSFVQDKLSNSSFPTDQSMAVPLLQ